MQGCSTRIDSTRCRAGCLRKRNGNTYGDAGDGGNDARHVNPSLYSLIFLSFRCCHCSTNMDPWTNSEGQTLSSRRLSHANSVHEY